MATAAASSASACAAAASPYDAVEKIPPPKHTADGASVTTMDQYKKLWNQSIKDPSKFWGDMAQKHLTWKVPFDNVRTGGFEHGDVAWFINGQMNVTTNCLDRHIPTRGDQPAIIWEGNDPKESKTFTYKEVLREVCKIANAFKEAGIKKGDAVTVYMPMIPELAFVMLACARIGAPHSVVFAGFSAKSLKNRVVDCKSRFVVTADEGLRAKKVIPLKAIVDDAVVDCDFVDTVFVFTRTGADVAMKTGRDVRMDTILPKQRPFCVAESLDAEDTLFYLYTSGSTGAPKGVLHTCAGYLLWTAVTHRYVFDLREKDIFACVADCGWITGHSYIVYGPLCNGATTLMFESTPTYPDEGRYWDLVQKHKVTQFYTAPTAIRALMKYGKDPVAKYDLSSLRVLGTVGEPINPEAWNWYNEVVGKKRCSIVDTYWQTETGGHMLTSLPGATPMKPGSATLPFFGIDFEVLDKEGNVRTGNSVDGVLCVKNPWPGMARTIFGNHERYLNVYMRPYPGYYFTGDGCYRDKDGYYWVTGRVDDVLNISGHRIGSAEVESALVATDEVAEAAVIGFPHPVKGQGIACFCILVNGVAENDDLIKKLRTAVRTDIGAFSTPDYIIVTPALPKTRSGKIMRRVLRKIVAKETAPEQLGDMSTLADQTVVEALITKANKVMAA